MGKLKAILVTAIILLLTFVAWCLCNAEEIPEDLAIRCIIGEAAGEGSEGMYYVAAALRNRGCIKGVYGCKSRLAYTEPQWVRDRAKAAYLRAMQGDPTGGADHWESTDFKEPAWAKDMIVTAKVGKHKFYRRIK